MRALAVAILFLSLPAVAADKPFQFSFDGHHRLRFEYSTGKDLADKGTREAFGQVVRLGATLSWLDRIQLVVRLQDVRTYGEETDTLTDFSGDTLDLHEGYILVNALQGGFRLSIEAGRRTWAYDDERILGKVGWTLQERRFDGARVLMGGKIWGLDLMYAKMSESDQGFLYGTPASAVLPKPRHNEDLIGLHAHVDVARTRIAVLLLEDLNDDDTVDRKRFTGGVLLRGAYPYLLYRAEFYAQVTRSKAKDFEAFFAGGEVGYRMAAPIGVEVVAGADWAGPEFDTLYATNHAFYGYMDFFLNLPVHTGKKGLLDAWGRVKVQPHPLVSLQVAYHHFRQGEGDYKPFGNEIDVVAVWKPWKPFALAVGGGVFLPGSGLSKLKGGGDETEGWFFAQTDTRF